MALPGLHCSITSYASAEQRCRVCYLSLTLSAVEFVGQQIELLATPAWTGLIWPDLQDKNSRERHGHSRQPERTSDQLASVYYALTGVALESDCELDRSHASCADRRNAATPCTSILVGRYQ